MSMTGKIDRVEVVTSVQRRRRWTAEEKARMVQETYAPGMSVSVIVRQHGIAPNQLFTWRRLYAEGALSAVGPSMRQGGQCKAGMNEAGLQILISHYQVGGFDAAPVSSGGSQCPRLFYSRAFNRPV